MLYETKHTGMNILLQKTCKLYKMAKKKPRNCSQCGQFVTSDDELCRCHKTPKLVKFSIKSENEQHMLSSIYFQVAKTIIAV